MSNSLAWGERGMRLLLRPIRRLTTAASPITTSKYRIQVGCILQRPPVVMRRLTPFERAYEGYRLLVAGQEESRGTFRTTIGGDAGSAIEETTQEDSDIIDEADEGRNGALEPDEEPLDPIYEQANGRLDDLRRHLDRKLYLAVKDAARNTWVLPTAEVEDEGRPLHQLAAEGRVLPIEADGADIYWVGRAPLTHHREALEGRVREPYGTSTFYFSAKLLPGSTVVARNGTETAWLTKEELKEKLPTGLYTSLEPVLGY